MHHSAPTLEASHAPGFSLELARKLAIGCFVAYQPDIHVGGSTVLEYSFLDLRAVIIRFDEHIEIDVRGTVDLKNWLLNLDVAKEPLANGIRVHRGFRQGADALLPLIIRNLLPPGTDRQSLKPIFITGHSLGGALASLIALFLQREGFPVAAVYTFASPRVGNAAWRKFYHQHLGDRTYRIAAVGDLVPLLPGLLDGYRHVGQEVLLEPDGKVVCRPRHWWEMVQDIAACWRAMDRFDFGALIRTHSIQKDYLPLIDKHFIFP